MEVVNGLLEDHVPLQTSMVCLLPRDILKMVLEVKVFPGGDGADPLGLMAGCTFCRIAKNNANQDVHKTHIDRNRQWMNIRNLQHIYYIYIYIRYAWIGPQYLDG